MDLETQRSLVRQFYEEYYVEDMLIQQGAEIKAEGTVIRYFL
ncbi:MULTISPECIES: hypothetical protein [Aerosakkonema]